MPVTHTLQAAFTQSIGRALVLPAGTKTMAFFGSGGDGNNANRVAGGAAITAVGSPAYAANYVTVGYNGTVSNSLNLNNPRDATRLAAGWTWAAVCRAESGGASGGEVFQDAGNGATNANLSGFALQGPANFNSYIKMSGTGVRATLVLGSIASSWHFIAVTYTGSAAGTYTMAEYTNVPAGSTPATFVGSGQTANNSTPVLGGIAPPGATGWSVPISVAWAFDCAGPMLQTDIAALAAAVRPWLARRGIVA